MPEPGQGGDPSTGAAMPTTREDGRELPPVPVRHPGRWATAAIVVFLLVFVVSSFVRNPQMRWDAVGTYLFARPVLDGLVMTVELTIAAMIVAIVVGGIIGMMRLSANPVTRQIAGAYVWFVRATPVIVQLLFWFFLGAVFPRMGIGIPWGPTFADVDTNVLIGQFSAAVLGLGLSESAYIAEIVRAGIIGVDHGQTEAAESLGMSHLKTMFVIILPQAMRTIIPPVANSVINMTKMTAIVLIIGLPDLLTQVQLIYARNFLQIPLLTVACFWYVTLVTVLTVVQSRIEARFNRGTTRPVRRKTRQVTRRTENAGV